MKNLLIPAERDEILERIHRLTPHHKNQWGQMNVQQMMCHVTDPLRDAIGIRKAKQVIPSFLGFIFKPLLLTEKDWKHGERTAKEYDQVKGGGTPTTTFENDKTQLLLTIDAFVSNHPNPYRTHVICGKLTNDEWGRLMYKHADHHLRSFGV
jgi:hypothetical protein